MVSFDCLNVGFLSACISNLKAHYIIIIHDHFAFSSKLDKKTTLQERCNLKYVYLRAIN